MRVLRICSVFETSTVDGRATGFDPVGGLQHHASQLSRALDAAGIDQRIVTAYRPGAARMEHVGERALVHRFGVPLRSFRQLYAPAVTPRIRRLARDCDVVHAHLGEDLAVLPLGVVAARAAGIPLVVTVHCSLSHTVAANGVRAALLRRVGGRIERRTVASADAVITLTHRLADRLVAEGVDRRRIAVIPSGADPRRFVSPPPDPTPTVPRPRLVFVGRLVASKGIDVLIDAFAAMRNDPPLVVVGDGPRRAHIERRAQRLGVAERITFTGFVPHHEVPSHLANAHVLVLPSIYEELGSVLVEALHAGLPVVASDVGGIPEVVRDGTTGRLVPVGDACALAAALDDLLDDRETLHDYRRACLAAAGAYDWEVLARQVRAVYDDVLRA